MSEATRPILYSFRRCPYAMRARMGLAAAGAEVELREVVLRDKPEAMIAASPKATVPVLILPDGKVIDESLDIMIWALEQSDDQGLLSTDAEAQIALVKAMDETLKPRLDRYKYPSRYEGEPAADQRQLGLDWIGANLSPRLEASANLFGDEPALADVAIFPFMRQFAHVDRDWFYATAPKTVCDWLLRHIESARFAGIMKKYKQWQAGNPGVKFPEG